MEVEVLTEFVYVMFDGWPSFLKEQSVKAIRAGSFVMRQLKNHLVNFLHTEWEGKMLKIIMHMDDLLKVKLNRDIYSSTKPTFELLEKQSTLFIVISNHPVGFIHNLAYYIFPVPLSSHPMKKLSIFITELSDSLGEPLFPINILHGKEIIDMILNDVTKKGLMSEQNSDFLKLVKKGNCHITASNEL
jgi:hypothetical protein